ncbi:DsbA family protein [uncultured Lentibacter sp.]|jgi:protein-disulfide isomerase|uniref:DsbA family protein n=1 Tax=uncultured Lentibacter sp. TaxID=1659309 RepID=UPI00260A5C98|nr:DsbA family protein [uncultured Lentibacter sp.]
MIRATLALACAAALASSPLAALDLTKMSAPERAALQQEIRAYLLENPEVIMEAVAVLEERQANAQAENDANLVQINADALFADQNSYVGGNPEGDLTLVEFVDYRCGYCRKAHDDVAQLIESDGNIRFIVKEFPILGEASEISARFAIATKLIAGDAAYKQASDALIALKTGVEEPVLRALAASLGIDGDAMLLKMASDEVTEVIVANRALGQRLAISGTPTFVMGDQVLRGYMPLAQMQDFAEAIRAQ